MQILNSPNDITGCILWLDGADTTKMCQNWNDSDTVNNVTNLSQVGRWISKASNGMGAVGSTGINSVSAFVRQDPSTRPTFVSSVSSIRFSSTFTTSLSTENHLAISLHDINPNTVFVVTAPHAYQTDARIFATALAGAADSGTDGYVPFYLTNTTGTVASRSGSTTSQSSLTFTSLSSFCLLSHRNSQLTSSTGLLNNFNGLPGTETGYTGNANRASYRIGGGIANGTTGTITANQHYSGFISEIIVYDSALSPTDYTRVLNYLTNKWRAVQYIPKTIFALTNGNWTDTNLWSTSSYPAPFNQPLSADNVFTNTFTITADSSTKVDTIRNSLLAPNIASGGSFVLANGVSLSANYGNSTSPITNTVLISSFVSTSAEIIGNLGGPQTAGSSCLRHSGTGIIYLSGSVFGSANNGNGANTIDNVSSGNINIVGNLFGGSTSGVTSVVRNLSSGMVYIKGNAFNSLSYTPVILNASTGTVYLTGNVYGHTGGNGTGSGVSNTGTGTVEMVGDAYGNLDPGVRGTNGIIRIYGNCIGSNSISTTTAGGLTLTTTGQAVVYGNVIGANASSGATSTITSTTPLSVYGNTINAPNGRQAIYAPRYQVFPSSSPSYTRQAVNGYDSFVFYYSPDTVFVPPLSTNVVQGLTYNFGTLTGAMIVPSVTAVNAGVKVGTGFGTAYLSVNDFWNEPLSAINFNSNTIGDYMRKTLTVNSLSSVLNSLDFSKV